MIRDGRWIGNPGRLKAYVQTEEQMERIHRFVEWKAAQVQRTRERNPGLAAAVDYLRSWNRDKW